MNQAILREDVPHSIDQNGWIAVASAQSNDTNTLTLYDKYGDCVADKEKRNHCRTAVEDLISPFGKVGCSKCVLLEIAQPNEQRIR